MANGGDLGLPVSKEKPLGYSLFLAEPLIMPKAWAEKVYPNLVQYKSHDKASSHPFLTVPA